MDVKAVTATRVGGFVTGWGESPRWDDRRQRLYFVDCLAQTLHWLDGGELPLHALPLPGLPTGLVLTEGDELVVCLDDGLHVVDADTETVTLLSRYPSAMGGRANDAHADGAGSLLTGTLNMSPARGSLWRFSSAQEWRLLDDDIGSTNAPHVLDTPEGALLVVADTLAAKAYARRYDAAAGQVGPRRLLADFAALGGVPDGAAVDSTGELWACVVLASRLVRLSRDGRVTQVVRLPLAHPSDAAFGGPDLDRLYVTSIDLDLQPGVDPGPEAGHLLVVEGTGAVGRREPRFRLDAR